MNRYEREYNLHNVYLADLPLAASKTTIIDFAIAPTTTRPSYHTIVKIIKFSVFLEVESLLSIYNSNSVTLPKKVLPTRAHDFL